MEVKAALYMIPVPISEEDWHKVLPDGNKEIIKGIKHFIVENLRTARRFLKKIDPGIEISELTLHELNGHTEPNEITGYLSALRKGMPMGVMSEAGCPGIADPGALVVRQAQEENLKVVPLAGPSSILMSLMASGMNGQKFAFHGYLPVKDAERDKSIRELEQESRRRDMTQIFIETPYRNDKMLESLLKNLGGETLLCVAKGVTDSQMESIVTRRVKDWKRLKPEIGKIPAIFLIYAGNSFGHRGER